MSTKKLIVIIVSVLAVLALVVAVFVGAIVGIAVYSIGHSEAAETAKTFLRNSERLKQDIGEVKDFGTFVTGNVDIKNNDGNATINLKVIGERKTVNASVDLTYRSGRPWRVIAASYRNDAGEIVELLNAYETQKLLLKLVA